MKTKTYDIVIIGGGIMGSATAYYLMKADNTLRLAVVEKDPTYERASSTLSMANVRIQFSLTENIQISLYTLEVLKCLEDELAVEGVRPRIYFHQEGNLFLVDEDDRAAAQKNLELQKSLGCNVEWWTTDRIKQEYPLYTPDKFSGGTFGKEDGHLDAYAMLMAYRTKARHLGAEYIEDEIIEITGTTGRVGGTKLLSGRHLNAESIINCAGAWAAPVAETAGVKIPVLPVKRQVFAFDPAIKPGGHLPLTILPSGLYFRTETGDLILAGKSMNEDPPGFDFTWDSKRFLEVLWPELVQFIPAFERLRLIRGWAGLYAVNTLDGNAIVGEWPEAKGLFLANGFSGHGLQQAPAVARYLAELILKLPVSLDLSIFGPQRILENKPLAEGGLV
jgi:glycine/D-amino acid oxidase-like deaminating enzyme